MYTGIKGYNRQNLCLARRAKRLSRLGSVSLIYRPLYRRRIVPASNAKASCSREQNMKNTSTTLRITRRKARPAITTANIAVATWRTCKDSVSWRPWQRQPEYLPQAQTDAVYRPRHVTEGDIDCCDQREPQVVVWRGSVPSTHEALCARQVETRAS